MTRLRSLRSRLLLGSLLWTLGLLPLAHLVAIVVIHHYPGVRVVHVTHAFALLVPAVVCLVAGLWQFRRSLSPFQRLRASLAAVREGRATRVQGSFPTEVEPLVDDLNALLAQREQMVERALRKAGDLAHGLKTPLAVLAQEAELAGGSHGEIGATLAQQVERMRRQIDYHLAHARAAASGPASGARCPLVESAEGLRRTLLRLHAARGLAIDVAIASDLAVRCSREDLDEMLGNLLDNACKWALHRVAIAASADDAFAEIRVDDDGPGLAPAMRELVLQRGVRADEAAPGSGLGLAIVRELAELHGGSITLESSPLGGLRATLRLPRATGTASSVAGEGA